ncbi:major facilitator superfamily domain-containing protein [Dipodascopsis uninucleata]
MLEAKKDALHLEALEQVDRVDKEISKYAGDEQVEIDAATDLYLKRKVDTRILPVMIVTYLIQALDKGTLSFASIMGLKTDTHLSGGQYSWLNTCTYMAVLAWEFPTNWIVQRVPIGKYLSFNIICWAAVLSCHAACTSFGGLLTVRTLLGIFECTCQPIFVVLSSMWYKREEQAARVAFWYMMNGGQQIIGGLLAYCFTLIEHAGLKNWQILFLVYGSVSIVWGLFVGYYMPDSPMKAKCFSEEDKRLMIERVRRNQTGLQNRHFRKEHVIDAISDPQVWCYPLIQLLTALPTSGLGAYANIIITSFGFTVLQTQLLSMVLGVYIIIVLLSSAWIANKTQQNLLVMIGYILPSVASTVVLITVKNDNSVGRKSALLFCYYVALSFWAAATLGLSMLSRNVGGQTKKSVAIAMNFVGWAVGNSIGPQVFLARDAPRYHIAFGVHMGCYAALLTVLVFLRFWLTSQNNKKDRIHGRPEVIDIVSGFGDLTDRENKYFRYIY